MNLSEIEKELQVVLLMTDSPRHLVTKSILLI